MTASLDWRCVVTGNEPDGRATFRADGNVTTADHVGPVRVGALLRLGCTVTSPDDGEPVAVGAERAGPGSMTIDAVVVDPTSLWLAEPAPAAVSADIYLVVSGMLTVDLAGVQTVLGPGEVFIARSQPYGLRTSPQHLTRLVRVRVTPDPTAAAPTDTRIEDGDTPAAIVRRVVAGAGQDGQAAVIHDGDPGSSTAFGDPADPIAELADVWEFGGRVASADQGGDATPWDLEPRNHGLKILCTRLEPVETSEITGNDGWHTTTTIDVDVIIDGNVELFLPNEPHVTLGPGDIVIQRGTNHRWNAVGEKTMKMLTVMVGVTSPG